MKAAPIQTSFNGGELSPLVRGRVDVAKFGNGCERMENFIPVIQGPAISRPGFVYVAEVKDSGDQTWLVRFDKSANDSYMLEFGDLYIRFYADRGVLLSGASPYEIVSPYAAADLTNSDGTFALRFVQTGDVVYIVHRSYAPRKLVRASALSWSIAAVDFAPPPFKAQNITATTIYASAATGTGITLTASAATFTAAMVGTYVRLDEKDVRSTTQWEAGKSITATNTRRSDGKNYEALNTATTGSVRPTHASGAVYDGDTGVQWQFLDPGFGWAKITAFGSSTSVTADVVSRIPANAVGAGNPTTRWALQAWNSTDGYPTAVSFFRERLVFARGSTLWWSVTGDFENFATEIDGVIAADAGFDRTLASDKVNDIKWLAPGDVLLVGTVGDEWAIVEATTTDPFGPNNVKAKRQSTYGSNNVSPLRVASDTVFVQKAGRKVRAMAFRFEEDGFESPDISVFAEHVTETGIVDSAYQQEPWSVTWCALADGSIAAVTFAREQDVVAWHRHTISGAEVETVECIPSPDGGRDDLWVIAKLTVDGATKRYVGYLADHDENQEDWKYSDFCASYTGVATTTITGLDYLEGLEVWVLTNGARHPNRTVSGGSITLQVSSTKVVVGLPCDGWLETMNLETGGQSATSHGKVKRAHVATIRVNESLGGKAGPSADELEEMQYRDADTPMGSAMPAFTGDLEVEWNGDYDKRITMVVKKDRPMPVNVVAVMPQMVVSEGR